MASNAGAPGGNYFILLILTDGIITDMHQTCDAIVNVSIIHCSMLLLLLLPATASQVLFLIVCLCNFVTIYKACPQKK